ncbi:MAG TPA: aldose epimerase family protein [Rhizomicrobium sp.]|jgi:aldose 1-epimerase|nr:aldose epimerase family protein [Rhizomicrobium sp.]
MMRFQIFAVLGLALLGQPAAAAITHQPWGVTPDGAKADLYTLTNAHGMQVQIATYAGTLISIRVPDRNGRMADVLMSHPTLDEYTKVDFAGGGGHYGELIGRFANRIKNATFTLDGKTYHLATVHGAKDYIHGGPRGLFTKVWRAAAKDGPEPRLALTIRSPDGDQGFPGNITVEVTYTLTRDNRIRINYRASTDRDTIINLTNHSYFNLKGEGDVDGTVMELFAHRYTPFAAGEIPTGEIRDVAGTAYDLTAPKPLGSQIQDVIATMPGTRGFDTYYLADGTAGHLRIAARAVEPSSGRMLEVWTTQPGFVFYTPAMPRDENFRQRGFEGHPAFCVETQHAPDAPNHPNFASTVITPDKPLHEVTEFRFSVQK